MELLSDPQGWWVQPFTDNGFVRDALWARRTCSPLPVDTSIGVLFVGWVPVTMAMAVGSARASSAPVTAAPPGAAGP